MNWFALLLFSFLVAGQTAEDPTVQAILFYSPTCPHCHEVLKEILIPIQEQYGDQLQIIGIDTSHPDGKEFFLRVTNWLDVPRNRQGVPTLIVGETVLVSSNEISTQFPSLIEEGLSAGGIGWPNIPDLSAAIPDLPDSAAPGPKPESITPAKANSETDLQNSVLDAIVTGDFPGNAITEAAIDVPTRAPVPGKMVQSLENMNIKATSPESEPPPADPVGFALAWLALFGMGTALIYSVRQILITKSSLFLVTNLPAVHRLPWVVLALALIGLGVALYLSYVEVGQVKAVCGPVGKCNIVQASPYARIAGIPIAVLGTLSYIAIIALWIGQRILHTRSNAISLLILGALTIFGTGFSAYLTVMELFVIRAVCAWCLVSAVLTTLLMVLVITTLTRRPSQIELGLQS